MPVNVIMFFMSLVQMRHIGDHLPFLSSPKAIRATVELCPDAIFEADTVTVDRMRVWVFILLTFRHSCPQG